MSKYYDYNEKKFYDKPATFREEFKDSVCQDCGEEICVPKHRPERCGDCTEANFHQLIK